MLVICRVEPAEVVSMLWASRASAGRKRSQWQAYCDRRALMAFVAERDGVLAGLAVAQSRPRAVHILNLEGGDEACRLLLARLIRLAGERHVRAWCPAARAGLRALFEESGFEREGEDTFRGRPALIYRRRNE
jgi:hypothetical protein